ncbi:hypothetical protein ACHAW5_001869 [Stephanodiscus triporus]|uniref:Uncharacterized protein n=1 Tax=Stephanodiscus triporus TaxID=2934178 RepID=A0ABD3NXJ7_9STRA
MKISAAIALVAASGASAYSVDRSSLRSLGQKGVGNAARSHVRSNDIKMEGENFGLLKGSGYGFDDLWGGSPCISEAGLEATLNKDGLRYKMNKTPEEAAKCEPLFGLPGFTVDLPLIGKTYLGPPRVDSVWEALGFTATSNNEARQLEKLKAIDKARNAKVGVLGGEGATIRSKWLEKYGYPRLVGSGGIFYADQLSTDKEAMGGFNMGKSGSIWPVPENVARGQYGGKKGWGMKKAGPAVDGLPKVDV